VTLAASKEHMAITSVVRTNVAREAASTQDKSPLVNEPGVGVSNVAPTTDVVFPLVVTAGKNEQVQAEDQEHSADSWASLYEDTNLPSLSPMDIAKVTSKEASTVVAAPVAISSTEGNNYQFR
jgi:hypothetical protein